jgi:hypothetical protein
MHVFLEVHSHCFMVVLCCVCQRDDILDTEPQPHTSLDAIASILETSVSDMAQDSAASERSRRAINRLAEGGGGRGGENSVAGLHVSAPSTAAVDSTHLPTHLPTHLLVYLQLMISTLRSLALAGNGAARWIS